jgi:hypothetical protein
MFRRQKPESPPFFVPICFYWCLAFEPEKYIKKYVTEGDNEPRDNIEFDVFGRLFGSLFRGAR